jgi:GntR family transcriptional regulator
MYIYTVAMYIRIAETSPESRWRQIHSAIRDRILSGELRAGEELPSIRQLAADTTVSVITIKRAYQQLESEGLIISHQGRGTYVGDIEQVDLRKRRLKEWREEIVRIIEEGSRLGLDKQEISDYFDEQIGKVKA